MKESTETEYSTTIGGRTMNKEKTFTIFGGTGDLTFRKLLPALYNMEAADKEGLSTQIVIVGRRDYTSETYRDLAREWVEKFARLAYTVDVYERFSRRIIYYRMDITEEESYEGLNEFYKKIEAKEHIFYFAVAPRFFAGIVSGLKHIRGACEGKVVIEKPFGEDLLAAKSLNRTMEAFFTPENIYRIDHYLGKEMVRNIQTIRFANPIFQNVWNAEYIDCIQISALEEVGVETRGGYYDHSGALKDMMQNHLFQILTIVAMERPQGPAVEEMHQEQMKVLAALKAPEEIAENMVLGQYEGYRQEPSVKEDSVTETYAAVRLFIDNDRWKGMPFYIRTGKKLGKREMQVAVVFKSPLPGLEYPEYKDTAYRRSLSAVQYQEAGRVRRYHPGEDGLLPELLADQSDEYAGGVRASDRRLHSGKPRVVFPVGPDRDQLELCGFYSQDVRGARALSLSVSGREQWACGGRPPA